MANKLSEERLSELKILKDRCDLVLDFLAGKMDKAEDRQIILRFRSVVERAYHGRKLGSLKQIVRELNDWVRYLPKGYLKELETRLQVQLGVDTEKEKALVFDQIHRILTRGRIRNDSEYRLLRERIEEIYDDESRSDDVKKIDKLLADYGLNLKGKPGRGREKH